MIKRTLACYTSQCPFCCHFAVICDFRRVLQLFHVFSGAALLHRQSSQAAAQHIVGVVGSQILNGDPGGACPTPASGTTSHRGTPDPHTPVPPGCCARPGSGPATPVTDRPMSAPVIRRAFSAMDRAHSSDTAPYWSRSVWGTPKHLCLYAGPVAHHAAPIHTGGPGQGRDPGGYLAAGAAFRRGEGPALFFRCVMQTVSRLGTSTPYTTSPK